MDIYKNIYAFMNKKIDYYNEKNYDINQIKNKIQRKIVQHNKEYKEVECGKVDQC